METKTTKKSTQMKQSQLPHTPRQLINLIMSLFILATSAMAYDDQLSSPKATVKTFINSFKKWDGQGQADVIKTLDLDFLPSNLSKSNAPMLAEYLKEVLDRTIFIEMDKISSSPKDSIYILVETKIGSVALSIGANGQWRFNQNTLREIESFYHQIKDKPLLMNVVQHHEKSLIFKLKEEYFGSKSWLGQEILLIRNWQWIGLLLLLMAGAILQGIFRILSPKAANWIHKTVFLQVGIKHKVILYKPMGHLLMSLVWMKSLPLLSLPLQAEQILYVSAKIFFSLTLVWTLWRVVDWVAEILTTKATNTESKFDDLLIPFVRTGLRVFVVALSMILTAETLNLPIQNLIAGLGIGAMAFAFAAKDTIENLFGSLTILLDRPFNIGDWVVIDGVEGTIEKLGFRSTRIRTFYNSQVTLPNSKMISATVDNMGEREYRRIKTTLGITYNTPAEKIQLFVEGIRTLIDHHPYTRKDYYQVYFTNYSSSSLDILIYVFLKVPDWSTELREKERLFIDILKLSQQLGVDFAFPTQTIHMAPEHSDGSKTSLPLEHIQELARQMAMSHFIDGKPPKPPKI